LIALLFERQYRQEVIYQIARRVFVSGLLHDCPFNQRVELQWFLVPINLFPLGVIVELVLEALGALPDDDGECLLLVKYVFCLSLST
jgi:hypothetical protein